MLWGQAAGTDLLERDVTGRLRQLMEETVDGDYQTFKSKDGAYIRKHFFGKYPETAALVEDWSDDDIWSLRRGGHDPAKGLHRVQARHRGPRTSRPVLLVKTVKGYGMGTAGEGRTPPTSKRRWPRDQLRAMRDRFQIPVSDEDIPKAPFVTLNNAAESLIWPTSARRAGRGRSRRVSFRRAQAGNPARSTQIRRAAQGHRGSAKSPPPWPLCASSRRCLRDKNIGEQVVPIVPDESRTFGMEGLFRSVGIYNPLGQHYYVPEDADQMMFYKESEERAGAAGGHQRGRRHGRLDRRGDVLFEPRRADDPVLHLLFDVRLPADRRSGLGRRRQPRAGLHAGRHGGAHHSTARGCSTRTGIPISSRAPSPTASPTTRPSATRSR